ncbi:MAG TPA: efflux RND transporter periplasmic adaptor subunit [Fimbriiglobus sp.]|nr:efflux RND transporter periplasmic adaptor subunit [Fimbriiglobus sp.]
MKRIAFAVLVLAVSSVSACYWTRGNGPEVLRLPGTVEVQEVRFGSRVGGRVGAVHVREGQTVEAGTVLVTFDAPELVARRDQAKQKLAAAVAAQARADHGPLREEIAEAKAAADSARAKYTMTTAGYRDEEKRKAESELAAALADETLAEKDYARIRELPASSGTERDLARANLDRARSRVKAAQAARDLVEEGYRAEEIAGAKAELDRWTARYELLRRGTREEDKAAAYAATEEARARLAEAETDLRETTVIAPEKCVIETVSVRAGSLVPPGQPVVVALRADDLWVKVFVPATELGRLKLGQGVEVGVDSHPGRRFAGEVIQIADMSEFTPRNVQSLDERRHQVFAVKVRVADPEGVFKSGMAAEVFVPLEGQ